MVGSGYQNNLSTAVQTPSDPTACGVITQMLDPGELLVWAGRPRVTALVAFSSVLAMLAICVVVLRGQPQNLAVQWYARSGVFPLCLVILAIVGAVIIMGGGIIYGITDRRALLVSTRSWPSRKIDFLDEYRIPAAISRWPFGLIFFNGRSASPDPRFSRNPSFLFFLGKDAAEVYKVAISAQRKLLDDAEQARIAAAVIKPR
ncbi:MAG TPA: hypothetical protein VNF29_13760 [Candidatus Binataceae bacterium]|nr:hypothetical protein [Candidatus Binataceae bacterium]